MLLSQCVYMIYRLGKLVGSLFGVYDNELEIYKKTDAHNPEFNLPITVRDGKNEDEEAKVKTFFVNETQLSSSTSDEDQIHPFN